ncbi:hypothetical protein EV426DRAFT_721999 [Tirmania nivea]|nr:hypothetical protein EV426DRAFT_721999 [Tirmania nivea]
MADAAQARSPPRQEAAVGTIEGEAKKETTPAGSGRQQGTCGPSTPRRRPFFGGGQISTRIEFSRLRRGSESLQVKPDGIVQPNITSIKTLSITVDDYLQFTPRIKARTSKALFLLVVMKPLSKGNGGMSGTSKANKVEPTDDHSAGGYTRWEGREPGVGAAQCVGQSPMRNLGILRGRGAAHDEFHQALVNLAKGALPRSGIDKELQDHALARIRESDRSGATLVSLGTRRQTRRQRTNPHSDTSPPALREPPQRESKQPLKQGERPTIRTRVSNITTLSPSKNVLRREGNPAVLPGHTVSIAIWSEATTIAQRASQQFRNSHTTRVGLQVTHSITRRDHANQETRNSHTNASGTTRVTSLTPTRLVFETPTPPLRHAEQGKGEGKGSNGGTAGHVPTGL